MLSEFLVSEIFTFLLIFARVGSAIMILPGFGEAYVLPRARLLLAATISLILAPIITPFPAPPDNVAVLTQMILAEVLIGLFIGTIARLIISTLTTAGMIIAYQSSLASAVVQDVTTAQGQSTSIGNLLGVAGILLMFALDLHHLLLRALVDSYQLFSAGNFPPIKDMSSHITQTVNQSFIVAMQISSPHIVMGLVVYLAGGIIARLMPNFQVFFILTAPQLMISFGLLMVTFSTLMMWYMDYFQTSISFFVAD